MATQNDIPPGPPTAQMVGKAFVAQYYHILQEHPESVYKFYQDISVISRPDPDGGMESVTTMKVSLLFIDSFSFAITCFQLFGFACFANQFWYFIPPLLPPYVNFCQ